MVFVAEFMPCVLALLGVDLFDMVAQALQAVGGHEVFEDDVAAVVERLAFGHATGPAEARPMAVGRSCGETPFTSLVSAPGGSGTGPFSSGSAVDFIQASRRPRMSAKVAESVLSVARLLC